jgi:hypothetical protein
MKKPAKSAGCCGEGGGRGGAPHPQRVRGMASWLLLWQRGAYFGITPSAASSKVTSATSFFSWAFRPSSRPSNSNKMLAIVSNRPAWRAVSDDICVWVSF